MVRQNVARRAALVDAAIEVLAEEGARGLTFRAVDARAEVPTGTASNYFASRDDLLTQAGGRIYERLQPDAATIAASLAGPRDRDRVTGLMHEIVDRISAFRSGYLALLELRLEATRRPRLREVLTERIRADVEANVRRHRQTGLPGDDTTVVLLYLALNWLIVERLTLPDVFGEEEAHVLVSAAVERLLP
ncbi:TetR family transcriptional regulator [Nonomuraea sp. KC401]|uniref:TetR family transcriptional regulator n=1 Tax=Nonomuraea longispora TaxID=1848320 RepID=A0A4R4N397_9ACTN|nr:MULTISPECIES: TetR/AcrR family transcriptional regulator [Nonomuraea]NBE96170.1 TetR family transcriptional regulator [Nonomuraea sp. K271]TDC01450.1 TetR family transcriptional regulator [Nonomuraea longispora]TLF71241.1 TetR family transcriptional regulator [Nonomuraea sp. KC401]